MYNQRCFLITLLLLFSQAFAQQRDGITFQKDYQLPIRKAQTTIKIDGEFTEQDWQLAKTTSPFWMKFPTDEGKPKRKTEVKALYDERFIYFSVTAYDSGKAFITSLKRDVGHDGNDGFGIVLDPVNQRTNGYFFVVNAFNAQSESLINTSSDLDPSWDNKWYSATKQYADKWTAEIAIPFKSLRYSADKTTWGINFVRIDTKSNEYSVWTHVPVNFRSYDIGYTGALVWDQLPPQSKSNVVFIPYSTGGINSDKENNQPGKGEFNAGFDAKVALNSSLNLDITVNPDFSQIEVDRQVTNLTRFNIFFPERRNFFLENADLYSEYGIPLIRPFYSRRIGLDKFANRIPILGGVRLTGNLNKRTRIGVMNMQTGRKDDYAPENYSAVSVKHQVFKRSSFNTYFLNRQAFMTADELKQQPLDEYGRNLGGEFNFSDIQGKWNAWSAYHKSYKPGIKGEDMFTDFGGLYNGRNLNVLIDYATVGTNYYADMGFIQRIENYDADKDSIIRLGFKQFYSEAGYRIFPKKSIFNQHYIVLSHLLINNPNNSFNERNINLRYNMQFRNTSNLFMRGGLNEVDLLFPTSFTGATPIPKGYYRYKDFFVEYESDFRKTFSYRIGAGGGEFYNGTSKQVSAMINYRNQPHLNIALQADYYDLRFPGIYGKTELLLIAPRVEINFNTSMFWTTFLQYNTQNNNFNINSRFQWRYKPMSDLFLVYTDNYLTTPVLKNRNRAIVFKLNYWLNL